MSRSYQPYVLSDDDFSDDADLNFDSDHDAPLPSAPPPPPAPAPQRTSPSRSPSPPPQSDPYPCLHPSTTQTRPREDLHSTQHLSQRLPHFSAIISAFLDFLEAAIHTILAERSVYPLSLFIATRKYATLTRQCIVPKVCAYVRDSLEVVGTEILEGRARCVSMLIINVESGKPLERFVFDCSGFPEEVSKAERYAMLLMKDSSSSSSSSSSASSDPKGKGKGKAKASDTGMDIGEEEGMDIGEEEGMDIGEEEGMDIGEEEGTGGFAPGWKHVEESDLTLAELEQQFRSAMTTLGSCSALLGELEGETTWALAVEMHENATPKNCERDWVLPEWQGIRRDVEGRHREQGQPAEDGSVAMRAIRVIEAGSVQMAVWVEEAKGKVKRNGRR